MARRAPEPGYVERLRAMLASRSGRLLLRLGALSLLVLVGGVVMRQARAHVYKLPDYRLTARSIHFEALPTWADARVQHALYHPRFYPLSTSIYDPDAESVVRDLVSRHPMVADVSEVRVLYPRSVEVRPVLRVPVATFEVPTRDPSGRTRCVTRYLAGDGSLLPMAPYAAYLREITHPLPSVTGIRARAPARLGVVWEDRREQVAEAVAAAELAGRLYHELQGRLHVQAIDVSRFPARDGTRHLGEVFLRAVVQPIGSRTRAKTVVIQWGRTERNLRGVHGEDSYETKVGRLRSYLMDERLPHTIDVRWPPRDA